MATTWLIIKWFSNVRFMHLFTWLMSLWDGWTALLWLQPLHGGIPRKSTRWLSKSLYSPFTRSNASTLWEITECCTLGELLPSFPLTFYWCHKIKSNVTEWESKLHPHWWAVPQSHIAQAMCIYSNKGNLRRISSNSSYLPFSFLLGHLHYHWVPAFVCVCVCVSHVCAHRVPMKARRKWLIL